MIALRVGQCLQKIQEWVQNKLVQQKWIKKMDVDMAKFTPPLILYLLNNNNNAKNKSNNNTE